MQPFIRYKIWEGYESAQFAQDNGYNLNVDLWLPSFLDNPDDKKINRLREASKDITIMAHGAFLDLDFLAEDQLIQVTCQRRVQESLKLAERIGSAGIVFHLGYNPLMKTWKPYFTDDRFIEDSVRFWGKVAAESKVPVLSENTMEHRPQLIKPILEGLAAHDVRFCFDLSHATIYSQTSIDGWVDVLGHLMRYVHLSDTNGKADEHLALGDGVINVPGFFDLLESRLYKPEICLELDLPKTKKSLAYLESKGIAYFSQ